jgi:serralysin
VSLVPKLNKKLNLDKITDFSVKDDSVYLDNAIFKTIGKGTETKPGTLNKEFFIVGSKAQEADHYLIYNKTKGILYYDLDGSGPRSAVEFAVLSKHLKMTYHDFFII